MKRFSFESRATMGFRTAMTILDQMKTYDMKQDVAKNVIMYMLEQRHEYAQQTGKRWKVYLIKYQFNVSPTIDYPTLHEIMTIALSFFLRRGFPPFCWEFRQKGVSDTVVVYQIKSWHPRQPKHSLSHRTLERVLNEITRRVKNRQKVAR